MQDANETKIEAGVAIFTYVSGAIKAVLWASPLS